MEIVLSSAQHDRLVEMLLDASLATYGRVSLVCGPGIPRRQVTDAWRDVCLALPTTRLFISWEDDTAPRAAVGDQPPPVRSDAVAPTPGKDMDPNDSLCRLFAMGTEKTVTRLVLDYSHLALDDRSAGLLVREVKRIAEGGETRKLPDITDYQAWLTSQEDQDLAAYWRTALSDLDGATPLFGEVRQLPEPQSTTRRELGPELADAVARVAAELGAPRSWLVLLGWAVVVARFRGGEQSAIGVLLDSRPDGLEDAVGVYESTLPMVVGLDRRPLPEWLADNVAAIERLRTNAHKSRAERNELSRQSRTGDLFDSTFDARPVPEVDTSSAPAPAVSFRLRLDENTLVADYDTAVVADDLAARLLHSMVVALTALTSGRGSSSEISLLDENDWHEVQRHNATAAEYPSDRCLHQLVEEQAERTPDAVALVHEGQILTYAEFNRRGNRLAHELIARGTRTDDIIGLCAEPGVPMCVGILGILKAGAAYAPLDPFFPKDRLDYLYRDLDCSIVLVEEDLVSLLPHDEERNIILDVPFTGRPETNPAVGVLPHNLAYVMYTSGSTGRPKGVLIEHGGAVNFVWWMTSRFELPSDQAALQWTAYSFDAAVWELFWPLFVGARAVIAPGKIHLDLERFIDLIATNEIATLHFVPAMLQTFLSVPEVERCTALSNVFVSGEPVPISLMRRFHERLDAELINLYGVTEVSIDSTYYVCPRTDDELPFVRSGVPLSNTQTYVLDESLQPVPFGARGEVFIAGDSVTRGYLGRRGLTADRFVPDPFQGHGKRMYKTGDIAQLLPDGYLRFLGRADHQVKIRGIRIELLEVAAEFNAFPAVRESLVVPFGDGAERGLVAYVIPEEAVTIDVAKLRAFVADQMPPYMVPNAIIVLDEFPLNSNGKVDRVALPDPAQEFSSRRSGRAPSGLVEERIAEIWCRLLDLDTVGADEEFFSVGGNSLLATQVIAEVRRTFRTQLSLREWLEASTIAQLADAIKRQDERDALVNQVLDEAELNVG